MFFGSSASAHSSRIAELERKVDAIIKHLGIEVPGVLDDPKVRQELNDLHRRGGVIAAIKRYRELTNCSLADAKRAVEQLFRGPT